MQRELLTGRINRQWTVSLPTWGEFPRITGRVPFIPLFSWIIIITLLLPVAYLILRAAGEGADGIEYLLRARTWTIIQNSLLLVGSVSISAALIGVPFAWLTSRTDLPMRRLWLVLGILPMVIPSYVAAVAFVEVIGPVGMVQSLLGIDRLPSIYGWFGAWLVITLLTFPYVVLPVRAALMNADPALEEAARSLGIKRWEVFLRVTLPQLRPALAGGMLLTALYTLSDFGVVMVLRYNAFTRAIYFAYNSGFNRNRAAILALVLVAMTLLLVLLERYISARSKAKNYRIGTGVCRKQTTVQLGAWRWPALIFCGALVLMGAGIPLMILLKWALNPNVTSAVQVNLATLGLNTAGVSLLAAITAGVVALPLAIYAVRMASQRGRWLVNLAYVGNALPGLVIGLVLVFFVMRALPGLYQTIPVLILGYVIRFLPFSLSSTQASLTQINPSLEEAARSLGLRPWQVALRITLPMAWTSIIAGMALVFLNAMKELPATLMLSPIGFRTLATRIWTAAESGSHGLIGWPGLMLMAVSCVSLALILWQERR